MSLPFRSINPSLKFRGCVQRLLRALITRELFVVENIQSQITVACTNRTYRTITCGHFMSLCLFIVLLNVVSVTSERKKKLNGFLSFHSNLNSEISQQKLKFSLTMQHIANGYLFQGYQPTSTVIPTFTQSNITEHSLSWKL
jgi:hypothetical protein